MGHSKKSETIGILAKNLNITKEQAEKELIRMIGYYKDLHNRN